MNNLLYITWTVDPEIFSIGALSVRWYGLFFATAFLAGHYIIQKMLEKEEQPKDWMDSLLIYMMVGTVLGARLGHVFFYQWDYYSENLLEILQVWKGGLASHGAAIGIIVSMYIWSNRISQKSILWILDKMVVAVAFAAVMIRMGNLMNHEIVGRVTESGSGFKFLRNEGDLSRFQAEKLTGLDFVSPIGEITDSGLYRKAIDTIASDPNILAQIPSRFPTQLFEAGSYLLIFSLLFLLYWRTDLSKKQGFFFGLFLVLLFAARFIIEFFKEVQVNFEEGMSLNMGQWLSIPLIGLGIFFAVRSFGSKKA